MNNEKRMRDYLKNQSPSIQRRLQQSSFSPSVPRTHNKNREKESVFDSAGQIEELFAMSPNMETNATNNENTVIHMAHPAGAFSIDHQRQQYEGGAIILDKSNDNDNSNDNYDDAWGGNLVTTTTPATVSLITMNVGTNNSIIETSSKVTCTLSTATPTPPSKMNSNTSEENSVVNHQQDNDASTLCAGNASSNAKH